MLLLTRTHSPRKNKLDVIGEFVSGELNAGALASTQSISEVASNDFFCSRKRNALRALKAELTKRRSHYDIPSACWKNVSQARLYKAFEGSVRYKTTKGVIIDVHEAVFFLLLDPEYDATLLEAVEDNIVSRLHCWVSIERAVERKDLLAWRSVRQAVVNLFNSDLGDLRIHQQSVIEAQLKRRTERVTPIIDVDVHVPPQVIEIMMPPKQEQVQPEIVFNIPRVEYPEHYDITLNQPVVQPRIEITVPEHDIQIAPTAAPRFEVIVPAPHITMPEMSPNIHVPSQPIQFTPEVKVDLKPQIDVHVPKPKIDVHVSAPDVQPKIDVHVSAPDVQPKIDVHVSAPDVQVDVKPHLDVRIKPPELQVDLKPQLEVQLPPSEFNVTVGRAEGEDLRSGISQRSISLRKGQSFANRSIAKQLQYRPDCWSESDEVKPKAVKAGRFEIRNGTGSGAMQSARVAKLQGNIKVKEMSRPPSPLSAGGRLSLVKTKHGPPSTLSSGKKKAVKVSIPSVASFPKPPVPSDALTEALLQPQSLKSNGKKAVKVFPKPPVPSDALTEALLQPQSLKSNDRIDLLAAIRKGSFLKAAVRR